jgi:hypothetical protein
MSVDLFAAAFKNRDALRATTRTVPEQRVRKHKSAQLIVESRQGN